VAAGCRHEITSKHGQPTVPRINKVADNLSAECDGPANSMGQSLNLARQRQPVSMVTAPAIAAGYRLSMNFRRVPHTKSVYERRAKGLGLSSDCDSAMAPFPLALTATIGLCFRQRVRYNANNCLSAGGAEYRAGMRCLCRIRAFQKLWMWRSVAKDAEAERWAKELRAVMVPLLCSEDYLWRAHNIMTGGLAMCASTIDRRS
jgi:hypothetical protein